MDKYDEIAKEIWLAGWHDGRPDGNMKFMIARALREAKAQVWTEAANELKSNRPEVLIGLIKLFESRAENLRKQI